jgi:hypothetical protein
MPGKYPANIGNAGYEEKHAYSIDESPPLCIFSNSVYQMIDNKDSEQHID